MTPAKSTTETKPARKHRTPSEKIADLEAEIERVKARAAAKEAKAAPQGKPFLAVVKAVDKALETAGENDDRDMVRALESARAALGDQLVRMGVRAPVSRKARGRAA